MTPGRRRQGKPVTCRQPLVMPQKAINRTCGFFWGLIEKFRNDVLRSRVMAPDIPNAPIWEGRADGHRRWKPPANSRHETASRYPRLGYDPRDPGARLRYQGIHRTHPRRDTARGLRRGDITYFRAGHERDPAHGFGHPWRHRHR